MMAVIGGGPAGLRAAEVAALAGLSVTVYEAKPSPGRKFLVAGRGGLNLTHAEPVETFARNYAGRRLSAAWWDNLLREFGPGELRQWADALGCETFVASSGRVYPRALKSAALLRNWLKRLRSLGVCFQMRHRWCGWRWRDGWELAFETGGETHWHRARSVVLALGGGSWPQTGSDGAWCPTLAGEGLELQPLEAANCGWEVAWGPEVLTTAEGAPLKNLVVRSANESVAGELLITRYGLEGGALYRLGRDLRAQVEPWIEIDLKPTSSKEQLGRKLSGVTGNLEQAVQRRWRLSDGAMAVLQFAAGATALRRINAWAHVVKHCRVPLLRPRPLEEAISTAGGVCWSELDDHLMLRKFPGIFVAGEMIDWEAPTGGYLLQGAFSTGGHAGRAASRWALAPTHTGPNSAATDP